MKSKNTQWNSLNNFRSMNISCLITFGLRIQNRKTERWKKMLILSSQFWQRPANRGDVQYAHLMYNTQVTIYKISKESEMKEKKPTDELNRTANSIKRTEKKKKTLEQIERKLELSEQCMLCMVRFMSKLNLNRYLSHYSYGWSFTYAWRFIFLHQLLRA